MLSNIYCVNLIKLVSTQRDKYLGGGRVGEERAVSQRAILRVPKQCEGHGLQACFCACRKCRSSSC